MLAPTVFAFMSTTSLAVLPLFRLIGLGQGLSAAEIADRKAARPAEDPAAPASSIITDTLTAAMQLAMTSD